MTEIHIDQIAIRLSGSASGARSLASELREALSESLEHHAVALAAAEPGVLSQIKLTSPSQNCNAHDLAERISQALLKAAQ